MSYTDTRTEVLSGSWFSFMSRTLHSDRTFFSVDAAQGLARTYAAGADGTLSTVSPRRSEALLRWRGLTPDGER